MRPKFFHSFFPIVKPSLNKSLFHTSSASSQSRCHFCIPTKDKQISQTNLAGTIYRLGFWGTCSFQQEVTDSRTALTCSRCVFLEIVKVSECPLLASSKLVAPAVRRAGPDVGTSLLPLCKMCFPWHPPSLGFLAPPSAVHPSMSLQSLKGNTEFASLTWFVL